MDEVVPQTNRDKIKAFEKYKFDIMFVGDDWKGNELFKKVEKHLINNGAKIVYFPYTKGISSTYLREILKKIDEVKVDL